MAKDKTNDDSNAKVSFSDMFRYATKRDRMLQYIGLFAASLVGISQPLMFIIYGSMVDNLVTVGKFSVCDNSTVSYDSDVCLLTVMTDETVKDMLFDPVALNEYTEQVKTDMTSQMKLNSLYLIGIGLGAWLFGWIQATTFMITSNRQINAIRVDFFRAILRQDAAYHDKHSAMELNNRLLTDVDKIQAGIGEKVGIAQQSTMQLIGGVAIGFAYGWKMALVVLACFPLLAFSGFIFVAVMMHISQPTPLTKK